MICPQCNAEYRPGFNRCADCDVDLVQEPPHYALEPRQVAEPGDPNEDPFCSFWKGQDSLIHSEVCQVLDEAAIPHKTVFRRDHLFNLSDYPSFEVGVPFSLFDKAEKAIADAFGTEDAEERETLNLPRGLQSPPETIRKLPAALTPSEPENIPGPPRAGSKENWYPKDATARVWSTDSGESADFLVAALHENGILCRVEQAREKREIFVLPQDNSRAREIVREIVEGQPPE
jgi:hypothetical protein